MRLVCLAMLSFLSVVLVARSVVRVSSSSILAIETLTSDLGNLNGESSCSIV
jgi:hypothetical protein